MNVHKLHRKLTSLITMNIPETIHLPWLLDHLICNNQMTIDEAAAEAIIFDGSNMIIRKIDRKTLKRCFVFHNLPLPKRKPGSIQRPAPAEVVGKVDIIRSKIQIGVDKTYERLIADSSPHDKHILHSDVYKAFIEKGHLAYTVDPKKPKLFNSRYESELINGMWHTDLHFFGEDNLQIIAFQDDKSRFITYWSTMADKSSQTTSKTLQKALEIAGTPSIVWANCWAEFHGQFEQLLVARNILHQKTNPYFPQQNGKIERFWRKLDRNFRDVEEIDQYIDQYHRTPHKGLPKVGAVV